MSYYTDEFNSLNSLIGALGSDTLSAGKSYELDKIALLEKLVSLFELDAIATGQSIVRDSSGSFIPENFALEEHSHDDATTAASGFLSAADKTKLDGIAVGATQNSTDAELRDRATHTGTQSVGTISGLGTAATLNAADPNWNANKIQGKSVSDAEFVEGSGQTVLLYNFVSSSWEASEISFSSGTMSDADILAAILRSDTNSAGINATTLQGVAPGGFATASHSHSNATTSADGFMSASDKTKIDAVAPASVIQKYFWAAPAESNGAPSFRAIGVEDLPSSLAREDENNYYSGSQQLQAISVTSASAVTINANAGTWFVISPLGHNATIQIPSFTAGKTYRIILSVQQPAVSLPIDWHTSFKFQNRAKPIATTTPGGWDEFLLTCPNGSDWLVSANASYGSL